MNKELISACKMFLGPSTILFAAIALAPTEGLKAGISLVGLTTALLWYAQVSGWTPKLGDVERKTAKGLAAVFVLVWAVSGVVHGTAAVGWNSWLPEVMRADVPVAKKTAPVTK